MPPAHRKGDIGSGHGCHFPPTAGSSDVYFNGPPLMRVGDAYMPSYSSIVETRGRVVAWGALVFASCILIVTAGAQPRVVSDPSAAQKFDPMQLEKFISDVKENVPPWEDAKAMESRLSAYGPTKSSLSECESSIMIDRPQGLSGIGSIIVSQKLCPETRSAYPSSIVMQFTTAGDAEAAKSALASVLGDPHQECSDDVRTAWAVSDDLAVALTDPFYPAFAVLIVNAPVTNFDCN